MSTDAMIALSVAETALLVIVLAIAPTRVRQEAWTPESRNIGNPPAARINAVT